MLLTCDEEASWSLNITRVQILSHLLSVTMSSVISINVNLIRLLVLKALLDYQ